MLGGQIPADPWRPALLLGSRSGYATRFAVDAGSLAQRRAVVGWLMARAAELAEEWGAASLGCLWLTSHAAAELAPCLSRPQDLVLAGPNSEIALGFDSFDGYLERLSWSRRRSARREMERFRASGLRVSRSRLSACLAELLPLAAQLQRRYGHEAETGALEQEYLAQARWLDDLGTVLLCRRGDELVGFALWFEWERTLYGRAAGFDYAGVGDSAAYFNLAFYEPIRLAIERGLSRLHLGMASWRAKWLRGASFDPTWSLICPPDALRLQWDEARDQGGDADWRWWAEQFPAAVDPVRDWRWSRQGLLGGAGN